MLSQKSLTGTKWPSQILQVASFQERCVAQTETQVIGCRQLGHAAFLFAWIAMAAYSFATDVAPVTANLSAISTPQNFNTLIASGTSGTVPSGFGFTESGSNADTTYAAGTGSVGTGDTYSFGTATASSDRAFGTVLSGNLVSAIGGSFRNDSGSTITGLRFSYTGEEFRLGTANRVDKLLFSYRISSTANQALSVNSSSYTSFSALDFSTPNTVTTGAKDGNDAANRVAMTAILDGISLAANSVIYFRFDDDDASGADDGLAIDDFSITPTPEPSSALLVSLGSIGILRLRQSRWRHS